MDLGIIKGRLIGKNRDGDKDRVILQVELIDEDVRTVELISQAGQDENPANGCRVYVIDVVNEDNYMVGIAVTDDLTPEVDPGEKEIYSTDSPVTTKLATLKWNSSGELELNGNADFAVSWTDLNTQLQSLVSAINAALATKKDEAGSAGGLSLDLSSAKVSEVKLP
jgi:hypothetical protein